MEKKKALLYMLAAALLFCFTEISLKKLNGSLNSIQVNFSRYLLAGILLLPAGIKERKRRGVQLSKRHIRWFSLLGFIGIALVGPLYQLSAVYLDAGVTGVIFSINPMCIGILAAFLLKEPISSQQAVGFVLAIAAILVIVDPFHVSMDSMGLFLLGLTVLFYSLYAVLGKKMVDELGSAAVTAGSFICGGLQLFLLAVASHVPLLSDFAQRAGFSGFADIPLFSGYTLENLPWVIILYVGVTLGAYYFWFQAMAYGSVALGSMTYFIKPVLTPLFALLILREKISGRMLAGILLMLAGAAVSLGRNWSGGNGTESIENGGKQLDGSADDESVPENRRI